MWLQQSDCQIPTSKLLILYFPMMKKGLLKKYSWTSSLIKKLNFFRSRPISSRHVKVLATLQILTITKKNLSASQIPKNALKNLPIFNKFAAKMKYKKNEAVVLCLYTKKKSTSSTKQLYKAKIRKERKHHQQKTTPGWNEC